MRCPRGDGELITRSVTGAGGIALTYHLCLGCMGHWVKAFDANYIPLDALPVDDAVQKLPKKTYVCPSCNEELERATGEAIPPGVEAWNCPAAHGYFFPRGNLQKFRMAQDVRIAYHKLWNIPTPPLKSVLLASVVLLALFSSVVAFRSLQQPQQTETQAREVLEYHTAVVDTGTVTIIGRTGSVSHASIVIPALGIDADMISSDGKTHTITIPDILPGTYMYVFMLDQDGKQTVTPEFSFEVP